MFLRVLFFSSCYPSTLPVKAKITGILMINHDNSPEFRGIWHMRSAVSNILLLHAPGPTSPYYRP